MQGAYQVYLFTETPRLVGTLHCMNPRGKARAMFSYANDWLAQRDRFPIDPMLPLGHGSYSSTGEKELFGCFSDCAPDRWGRMLLMRNEKREARQEKRTPRSLSEFDYLFKTNAFARMGAFVFIPEGATFTPPEQDKDAVPPLLSLRKLMNAALTVTAAHDDIDESLALLFQPGSSLGGARPKASILAPDGTLMIAKFPSTKDIWDVPLWEYISLTLAQRAKMHTPTFTKEHVHNKTVLLLQRFDRTTDKKAAIQNRIHFASAMTLLGANDGDHGTYEDMAAILMESGAQPKKDLEELWRRMVFNILTNNTDDHLRNHGFLRIASGWTLSPVYDLESSPITDKARILHTHISYDAHDCSTESALGAASNFNLKLQEARTILKECNDAVATWYTVAKNAGASRQDIDLMADSFMTL